jgi:PPOX class probable F420-dependent enzyme
MKRRDLIRMTDEEVRAFLEEGHTLQVATIGRDGFPHLVAMWYVLIDGDVAFWTYARSQKVVNLRRDSRLACLIEEGERYDELRGVQIKGHGVINDDHTVVQRVGEEIWKRYTGSLDESARQAVAIQGAKRVAIFVKPSEVVSWDHRKLGGTY